MSRRPHDTVTDAIAEVLAVEQRWTDAHLRSDVATIARLMAPDYAKIEGDGAVLGREEVLATFEPGQRVWEVAAGDCYDVRVYGDTAVVIGRWTAPYGAGRHSASTLPIPVSCRR